MKVKDVMHPDAIWVGPETPVAQIEAKLQADDAGAVPVSEYDRLVGVVTRKDLARCGTANATRLTARDVMSKPIIYCYPEEEVAAARNIMRKHAVRRLPVVSHQKRIIGSVMIGDIAG